jgi:hypothetical protein
MAPPKKNPLPYQPPKGGRLRNTELAGFFKPEKAGDAVHGVLGHRIETKGQDGRPNIFYTLRLADVAENAAAESSGPLVTKHGKPVEPETDMLIGVGGKVAVARLDELEQGAPVSIYFAGMGEAKRGQSAPKLYHVYDYPAGEGD